jgi:hypothetical protein
MWQPLNSKAFKLNFIKIRSFFQVLLEKHSLSHGCIYTHERRIVARVIWV